MINYKQLREAITDVLATAPRPVNGEAAINLLLGTAAQESHFGTYIEQIVGPAKGIFQIEPKTAQWIEDSLPADFREWLKGYRDDEPIPWALEYRLDYSIACCRMRYLKVPAPIPADLSGQAAYWKKYYNTIYGKGTVEEYTKNVKRYCVN